MEPDRIEAELKAIHGLLAVLAEPRLTPVAVSLKQAAEMLSCSPRHISSLVRDGELTPRKVGSLNRIPVSQIYGLLDGAQSAQMVGPTKRPRFDAEAFRAATKKARRERQP